MNLFCPSESLRQLCFFQFLIWARYLLALRLTGRIILPIQIKTASIDNEHIILVYGWHLKNKTVRKIDVGSKLWFRWWHWKKKWTKKWTPIFVLYLSIWYTKNFTSWSSLKYFCTVEPVSDSYFLINCKFLNWFVTYKWYHTPGYKSLLHIEYEIYGHDFDLWAGKYFVDQYNGLYILEPCVQYCE